MNNNAWKSKSTISETPWGFERRWNALAGVITGKTLHIRKGERTSFKYYKLKDEVLFMYSGAAKITYASAKYLRGDAESKLVVDDFTPGECLNIQSGCPYRIEALEDCIIIEIGDRSSSEVVRLKDDHGRECAKEFLEDNND